MRWEPVALTISCGHESVPWFIPWDPAKEDVERSEIAHSGAGQPITAQLTRNTTRTGQPRTLRSFATPILLSWLFPASAFSASEEQKRSAHHDRVLHQRDSRDGRGECSWKTARFSILCHRRRLLSNPSSSRSFITTWRSPLGSVSHRVLGTGRSQAAANAGRGRIQPQDCAGDRRRQWNRPRSRSAARRKGAHSSSLTSISKAQSKVAQEVGSISLPSLLPQLPWI